jgi:hypothetical protein
MPDASSYGGFIAVFLIGGKLFLPDHNRPDGERTSRRAVPATISEGAARRGAAGHGMLRALPVLEFAVASSGHARVTEGISRIEQDEKPSKPWRN